MRQIFILFRVSDFPQLHNWLGWAIALLGLAQIPLGLTLYGSPKVLFILYALAATAWLVAFFLLTRRDKRYNGGGDYGSRYSYNTSSVVDDRRRRKTSRGWLKPVLAGIGIYWLIDKFRKKPKYREDGPMGPEVVGSRRHSASYVDDDKYSYYSDGAARWEDRWLKIATPIGLAWLVRRYYDRKYGDEVSDLTSNYYRPAPGEIDSRGARGPLPPGAPMPPGPAGPGAATYPGQAIPPNQGAYPGQPLPPTQAVPPGPNPYAASYAAPLPPQGPPRGTEQPLASEHHPLNRGHSRESSFSTSHPSAAGEVRRSHSLRDGLATFGAVGMAKNYWNRWRDRNQDRRIQNERDSRIRGSRFTGDGGPRTHRPGMSSITSESSIRPAHPTDNQGIPPIPAGTYAAGSTEAAVAAAVEREREQRRQEALPLGGVPRPVHMPAIPPDPQGILHRESSTSESFSSAEGQQRRHSRRDRDLTPAPVERSGETAAPPLSPPSASKQKRQERYQSLSPGEDSGVTSPPVSVRVKMHKDGRHVTLSRLPRDEAEARRTQTRQSQSDSVSSLGGDDGGRSKFRRRDDQERQNAEAMRIERENLAAARAQAQTSAEPPVTPSNLPIPPPIPESSGSRPSPAVGSVGSPGTYETDASADYANNRRRRRAERARVKAKSGKTVGFE